MTLFGITIWGRGFLLTSAMLRLTSVFISKFKPIQFYPTLPKGKEDAQKKNIQSKQNISQQSLIQEKAGGKIFLIGLEKHYLIYTVHV